MAGTITLAKGTLAYTPKDSQLLRDIIRQPLSLPIEGRVRDMHADTDPFLFLQSLHRAHPGPFLRVTPVEPSPDRAADIIQEGLRAAEPRHRPSGHDGAGQASRQAEPQGPSPSVSANRTDAWDHERLG